MSIDNRAYLKIGERILLSRNKAGNDQEVYQITGRVGEGGSAICYEAVRNRNGHLETGLLKEFYPADDIENNIVYSIFRLKNGQIVPGAGTLDRFVKMRDEYMDAYNLLNDKMLESEDNRLMGNFIQIPELLYGCFDEDVESPAVYDEVDIKALSEAIDGAVPTSGYIWTRGVVGQSYGEFIKEIKRNSESNSDFKLLQVIQTVIALTEGVMSIHVAGLLHLDIKPSNFMLPYREGQIVNEHTISMYDVNTLYMVGGEYLNPMGTDGFCAPEIVEMEDQPDNRADIYSIGAVLFNAIIVKDGIGNELYVDETYGEIRQLVKSSKLFTSGEAGTNEEFALIKKAFFPVMEANLYRDYKSYDDVLVGKIPFILTYSFIEHVVVAFDESEEFNGRLNNVAAVTVLCPKKIDYIYYCDEHSDVDKVMTGLKAVLGYLDSREIHCQVRFVIAGSRECGTTNMLEKGLSGIESGKYQNVRFEGCTLLYCNPSQDAAYNEIVQYLQSDNCIYECSNLLFHDGKKYEAFKSVIKSAGIAYYSFDWRNKHFTKHNGCDYLQYIHDASFLTMENIAALKGTDSAISDIPEYQKDYEALWQIYESDKNAWRALCSCIDEYELRNKPLAQFEILGNECNEYTEKLSFVLPEYTEKTVRRLLRELSERDILRDDIIENYTSESYIVKFSVSKKYRHAFDTLFADPRILLDYYGVRAYNESKYVRVGYNNLEVVDISRIEENSYRMLEKLQDKHFINGLRREDSSDKVSFAFTSPRIKRVMMKTNRVLLLRAYYETLKYGYHEPNRIAYFDDVVYGSKIGNQDESDALFITKGFRHIKITDMGEWSDEQLACIGDTLNEKLRENNQ